MDSFRKTLENLRAGVALAAAREPDVLTVTGLVSLFEICFEQSWKAMKKTLHAHGFLEARSGSPRAIIKLAYREGMIRDEQSWLNMLDDRSRGVHTYNEAVAEQIAAAVPEYVQQFEQLLNVLNADWS
ncbi:MAG: nucleotidyltransferase [Clostridia bacterium]|nr:nucleotidyltransferase [Clostridia bacterium]